jgi:hypothetical protein
MARNQVRFLFVFILLAITSQAWAELPQGARVCVLVFTQAHEKITTSYSCDGSATDSLPVQGRTILEEQSAKFKFFMSKMLIPKTCSAVNTTHEKDKIYQLTCVLYS